MAAGDVDGDGILEFAVGFNGGGGVRLLDSKGQMRWRQPDGNVWHVECVDVDGDGRPDIVHSNAGGELKVRDKDGNFIRAGRPQAYFSHFSLCEWPPKRPRPYALSSEDDTIWLFDFDGTTVAHFRAPQAGTLGEARGVLVKLKANEPEYLAVLVAFRTRSASILYVYDPQGALVYQEVLGEDCEAVAASPPGKSGVESLLVGGEGQVWQYKAQNSGP